MADTLDKPDNDDEIYLARGDEVPPTRPLMTGDVFSPVVIPGVSEEDVVGMIVTHPCSMREDGVTLVPKLHAALVEPSDNVPWKSCARSRMPLPALRPGEFHLVRFDLVGMVDSHLLAQVPRLACMAMRGVNLLQQRLIWYFTRLAAPTGQLSQLFTPIFEEIDLQEEWVEAAIGAGTSPDAAADHFHEWIRADDGSGTRRQDRLRDPQARSMVRRSLDTEVRQRYPD